MPFTELAPEEAVNIEEDHLFSEVLLDDADVVVNCRVKIEFGENQFCDAIVAAFASREANKPVGDPIDDLSFLLTHDVNPNETSFPVSGVTRFSVLVRRTGAPGSLSKATFRHDKGTLTNRTL
jgi:hypothetical protein